jgi:hypothetical protein
LIDNEPNPEYSGKVSLSITKKQSLFYRRASKEFIDGDTVEFVTQKFYKQIDSAIAELAKIKQGFINNLQSAYFDKIKSLRNMAP